MGHKFVRKRVTRDNSLHLAIAATTITRELVDIAQFPPARALVSVLLLIFETVQQVQTNKDGCQRLASRAARILLDISDQMEGRWDSAPPMLIKNLKKFNGNLIEIHNFMLSETSSKWSKRFLRKTSIETALEDYTAQLEDAAQSFQIATLISIHYAVSSGSTAKVVTDAVPPPYEGKRIEESAVIIDSPVTMIALTPFGVALDEPEEFEEPEAFTNFPRYHQSEIRLRGRTKLSHGWWEGTEVEVNGHTSLLKQYEGPVEQATKAWLRDVKLLQNVYHPGLPQLMGLSDERAQAPFILLANVKTRSPQALLLDKLRLSSLASCAELMLRFYRDIVNAAMYAQRQFDLSESDLQGYLGKASFRIDSDIVLVMDLPPPKKKNWMVMRSYGLTESFLTACLGLLPNRDRLTLKEKKFFDEQVQIKIDHLIGLARGLLPAQNEAASLSPRVQNLLDESPDDERVMTLTLDDIRRSNIDAGLHEHRWSERHGVKSHQFKTGEVGYVPRRADVKEGFVKILDVELVDEGEGNGDSFEVVKSAKAEQWCWEKTPIRREALDCFELPRDVAGWPVPVPPSTQIDVAVVHETAVASTGAAWKYLLDNAPRLAKENNIYPDEIIFITRSGTSQDFYIRQVGALPFGAHKPGGNVASMTHPNFHARNQPRAHVNPFQMVHPTVLYLFTSPEAAHEPYWSTKPMVAGKGKKPAPALDRQYVSKVGWCHGFMDYVQLHQDDF